MINNTPIINYMNDPEYRSASLREEYQKAKYYKNRLENMLKEYRYQREELPAPVGLYEMQINIMKEYLNILEIRAQVEGVTVK